MSGNHRTIPMLRRNRLVGTSSFAACRLIRVAGASIDTSHPWHGLGKTCWSIEVFMQRTVSPSQRPVSPDRVPPGEVARRAAVLVVVVAPFLATIVAIVQLWQWLV